MNSKFIHPLTTRFLHCLWYRKDIQYDQIWLFFKNGLSVNLKRAMTYHMAVGSALHLNLNLQRVIIRCKCNFPNYGYLSSPVQSEIT
jgi:hypothetical protein